MSVFPKPTNHFSPRHILSPSRSIFTKRTPNHPPTMQSQLRTLNNNQIDSFKRESTSSKISLGEVFKDRTSGYLNELTLFIAHFNAIPNCCIENNINCMKASQWFSDEFTSEIQDMHYNKRYFKSRKKADYDDIFYFLYDDLMVYFDTNLSTVRFLFRKTDIKLVEDIIEGIKKFKGRKSRRKPRISLIVNTRFGVDINTMEVTKQKFNIHENYNDDFEEVHQTIIKRLSKKNEKGLVLLHGKPGTGKTSYIRYLCATLKKDIIFLPPNMAGAITNPDLISILIDNPNSIFVIEDAENIVADREQDGKSPVSALLNISDGLLSDCLNIQIICSFNTPLSKVDSALLRKGRLIAKYEFNELDVEKAQHLSNKLGFVKTFNSPMTLAAIYNQEEKDFVVEKSKCKIGFRTMDIN